MLFTSRNKGVSTNKLENENRQLNLQLMTLLDQLENLKKVLFKYQEEYNKLSKLTKSFCLILLDNKYATNQLGGTNIIKDMDIYQLLDYAKAQYKESQASDRDLLLNLTNQIQQKDSEIESLKTQISQYITKEKHIKEFEEDINEEPKTEVKVENKASSPTTKPPSDNKVARVAIIDEDVDILNPSSQKPIEDKKEEKKKIEDFKAKVEAKKPQENTDVKAHVVNLNDYINKMSNVMWEIVLSIGKEGLSESKDIKKRIVKKDVTESSFNIALSQLRKMNIINQEKINTGWRWFHSFELSDIGKRIYLENYKQSPIECEKQILKKEHTSALHGYCIKDSSEILKSVFGYDKAITDRKNNTMALYTGEKYIPDIIAKKKEGSLVDYFEVELGHHTQKDFNKKCDKMKTLTRNLYFIVPDAGTMDRVLARQIGQWVLEKGGKDKLKGTTVYLTTLTKLNEGKWERVYPF